MVVFVFITRPCPSFHHHCYSFSVSIHDHTCHCVWMLHVHDCLGLFNVMFLTMLVVMDCAY